MTFARPVAWRVITRLADSGGSVGFSNDCSSVRSVEIKNNDMLMLRIVRIVRRRLRKVFLKMNERNFMQHANVPVSSVESAFKTFPFPQSCTIACKSVHHAHMYIRYVALALLGVA